MSGVELADALSAVKRLPLPSAPDSEELDEWRANLIEVDAFYVGIASTVLNGGQVEHYLEDLDTLRETLHSIQPGTELDERIHARCRAYLEALSKLREALVTQL